VKISRLALALLMLLPTDRAHAQDAKQEDDRKVTYRQKTEIDFLGLEVEAVLQRPQSTLVLERKKASFNPLIKLRTDWSDAIEQSVEEIK